MIKDGVAIFFPTHLSSIICT